MIKIATCETGINLNAVGDTDLPSTKEYEKQGLPWGKSFGIFQVRYLEGRPDPKDLITIQGNIKAAKRIYLSQGYGAWYNCSVKIGLIK